MIHLRRRWMGAIALGCIALQLDGSMAFATAALGIWILTLVVLARPLLRRLWRPKFWTVSVIMAIASGWLLGKPDLEIGFLRVSTSGIEAGLLMVVRGAFVFALMAWASTIIVDQDLQRALRTVGLARVGEALAAAFELIPSMTDRVRPALVVGRGHGFATRLQLAHRAAVDLVVHAAVLSRSIGRPPIFIAAIVGPPGAGKTTLAHRLIERLQNEGIRLGGVTQPAIHQEGLRVGYRLRDVGTGEEIPFATRALKGFDFSEIGWRWASDRITRALTESDCIVVDEMGLLEAKGLGHLRERTLTPTRQGQVLLLSVREACADAVAYRVGQFSCQLTPDAAENEIEAFVDRIVAQIVEQIRPEGRRRTATE